MLKKKTKKLTALAIAAALLITGQPARAISPSDVSIDSEGSWNSYTYEYTSAKEEFESAGEAESVAEGTLTSARKELDDFNAEKAKANTSLSNAEAELSAATSEKEAATSSRAEAQQALNTAKTEGEAKKKENDSTIQASRSVLPWMKESLADYESYLADEEAEIPALQDALTSKKTQLTVKQAEQKKAKDDADAKTGQLAENASKTEAAEASRVSIQEEISKKENEISRLTNLDKMIEEKTAMLADLSKQKTTQEQSKANYQASIQDEYVGLKSNETTYKTEADAAQAKLDRGMFAFFEDMGSQAALDVLNSEFGQQYYDPSRTDDATSFENVFQAIDMIRVGFDINRQEGFEPYDEVADRLMAIAEVNANYIRTIEKVQHSHKYVAAENIAGGSSNPYNAWYVLEKQYFEEARDALGYVGTYKEICEMEDEELLSLPLDELKAEAERRGVSLAELLKRPALEIKEKAKELGHEVGHLYNLLGKKSSTGLAVSGSKTPYWAQEYISSSAIMLASSEPDDPSATVFTVDEYEARLRTYVDGLQAKVDRYTTLAARLEEIETAIGKFDNDIAETQAQIEQAEAELASLNAEKETASQKIASLTAELAPLNKSLTELDSEITALNAEKATLEAELAALNKTLQQKETEVAAAEKAVGEAQTALDDLLADYNDAKAEMEDIKAQVEELNAKIAAAQADNERIDADIAAKQAAVDKAGQDIKTAEAKENEAKSKIETLNTEIKNLEGKIKAAQTAVTNAETAYEVAKGKKEAAEAKYNELKAIVDPDGERSYGEPVWSWSEDFESAELTLTRDDGLIQRRTAIITKTTTEEGISFKAEAVVLGTTYQDTREQKIHTHHLTKVEATSATCCSEGNKEYWICNECQAVFWDEEGTKPIADMSETVIPVDENAHMWSEWVITKEATPEGQGIYSRHCLNDESHTEEMPYEYKAPEETHTHEMERVERKEATCCAEGNIEYWICRSCNKMFFDEAGEQEITDPSAVVIPKTQDHNWGEWKVVKEATETEEGLERKVCQNDPTHIEERTITKLDHTHEWGEWEVIKAATETEEGLERRVCLKNPEHKEERTIAKLEHVHTWGEWKVVKEPTYLEEGLEKRVCEGNAEHFEERPIDKLKALLGDVDLDGVLTVKDVTQIRRYINGYENSIFTKDDGLGEFRLGIADVDKDGILTARDATQIIRRINGLVSILER